MAAMTSEEFLDEFVAGWAKSKPDGFIEHFTPMAHPDVVATQPLLPAAHGPDAYLRSFRNTFALMPDFAPEILATAIAGDVVFIESRVSATIGGRKLSFDVADRFVLRDGMIYRRHAYFDPTPIIVAILLRPWVLPAAIRCLRG